MPKDDDNELSDLLSDLAAAQAKQEEELHALTGGPSPQAAKKEAERIAEEELLDPAQETATVDSEAEASTVEVTDADAQEEDEGEAIEEEAVAPEPEVEPDAEPEPIAVDESVKQAAGEGHAEENDALAAMAAAAGTSQGEELEESHVADMEAPIDLGVGRTRSHAHIPMAQGRSRGARMPKAPPTNLKAVMAPVVLTFGLLLLLLAVWGTLMAMGVKVPLSDRAGSGKMGLILALAGWPMGLFLVIYAVIAFRSLSGDKKHEEE